MTSRGASVFEYALVLVGVSAVALVGASAVGGRGREVAHWESGCVKALECGHANGSSGASSIAPEQRDPLLATASDAWAGVRSELSLAGSETVDAALEPRDVVRGFEFLLDHPAAAFRAIVGKKRSPAASAAESTGRSGARVATAVSPAVVGRLATIGKIMARGSQREQWAELDALADGEDWQP